ncbi:MAG TPA: RsmB/NOP family class I SAM-dependent RNA methyltransferase, partial [Bacteroidota bacterium]|nr:RsmB/NOP family class I SAM-dependent RNA methyltransferase [Bacteroidota bacterium]
LLMLADRRSTPVDRIVSEFFRERHYLGPRDRRGISDTLFGFIRHRRYLETLLEGFLAAHESYDPIDEAPRRYVPLLVIYSVVFPGLFGGCPPADTGVNPLWTPYFPALDPGPLVGWTRDHAALDFLEEDRVVTLGVRYSFQDWMVAGWIERWPDDAEALLGALNRPGDITLRVNRLKTDRESCLERLAGEGIGARRTDYPDAAVIVLKRFNQNASASFREGLFEIQDAGSQLVSLVCAPRPGQLVIDGCAGAGGKTLHLADLMENRGNIIAIDTDPGRLRELHRRAERAGVGIVEASLRKEFREKEYAGKADIVLVDAPCSGSGTIRRNPSLKWSVSEEDIRRYAARQAGLLDGYAPLVRRGGRLVYSTCSLFREENEEVALRFLDEHEEFRSAAAAPASLLWADAAGEMQSLMLLPHRHHTDGFFIAAFERTA